MMHRVIELIRKLTPWGVLVAVVIGLGLVPAAMLWTILWAWNQFPHESGKVQYADPTGFQLVCLLFAALFVWDMVVGRKKRRRRDL